MEPMVISLDIYQTTALAVIVFYVGKFIREKFKIFVKYCIPAPVIGGIIFAALACVGYATNTVLFEMDTTLQTVFMTVFFTSVGFTACFKLLLKSGLPVIFFLVINVVLVVLQNLLGVGLATVFNLDPLLGLCVGSIPMIGGHGTAGSYGPLIEEMGVVGANTVALSAATFGLVMGCLIGGPVAKARIDKRKLEPTLDAVKTYAENEQGPVEVRHVESRHFMNAMGLLFLATGLGVYVYDFFMGIGFTLPIYIGAMLVAAVIRNIADGFKIELPEKEIDVLGGVFLSLYLAMALMALKIWQLADLALPMLIMLLAQTVLMAFFSFFVTFNVMGRDYEAAVISAANCGFGMGATPNAMANMQAVTAKYGPAPRAFFIVPLVGSLFIDFFNGGILTIFVNILK